MSPSGATLVIWIAHFTFKHLPSQQRDIYRGHVRTWLLVNTLKMCSSESGAKPWHSLILAITPATKVPWPRPEKQDVRLLIIHSSLPNVHTRLFKFLLQCCLSASVALLTIIQCLLIGPVGSFLYVLKMWVLLAQARVEHCHLHTRALTHTQRGDQHHVKETVQVRTTK